LKVKIRIRAGRIFEQILRLLDLTEYILDVSAEVWRAAVLQIENHLLTESPAPLRIVNIGERYLRREDVV